MAVAGEDAGVTLVSYIPNKNIPSKPPQSPKTPKSSRSTQDPKWKVKWNQKRPHRSGSLSRLLAGCVQKEDKENPPKPPEKPPILPTDDDYYVRPPALRTLSDPQPPVKLVGYKRSHSYGGRDISPSNQPYENRYYPSVDRRRMERTRRDKGGIDPLLPLGADALEKQEKFSEFVKQSHDRFNQFLEERGFAHIPPPAGFGNPTRPSSLLTGSSSVEDALSHKRSFFTAQRAIKSDGSPQHNSEELQAIKDAFNTHTGDTRNGKRVETVSVSGELEDAWCDLPTSPISPPSPFQHPLIRRQLALSSVPPDPWARFSGFGIPRLTPLIFHDSHYNGGNYPDSDLKTVVHRRIERGRSRKGCRGQYSLSSTRSMVRYCTESSSYK